MSEYKEAFDRLKNKYADFENIDDFITIKELVDKATPKKPFVLPNDKNLLHYECPNCKKRIWSNFIGRYCRNCGQKLLSGKEND